MNSENEQPAIDTDGASNIHGADDERTKKKTTTKRPRKRDETTWTSKDTRGCALTLAVVAVIAIVWFAGPGILAVAQTLTLGATCFWIPVLAAGVPLLFGLVLTRRGRSPRSRGAITWVSGLFGLLGIAFVVGMSGWLTARAYSADVAYTDAPTNYQPRAPWVVAENYASREQGELVGDRLSTHFVPEPAAVDPAASNGKARTSRYTSLVNERAFLGLGGLEAVHQLRTPITGTVPGSAADPCRADGALTKRLTSFWPWHSLRYSIWMQKPTAHFDARDAYGYCSNGTPVVVVPLWAYDVTYPVTQRPDGAAVYTPDGLRVLSADELVAAGIEGPTYPRSLAETQRSALRGDGSLLGYWSSVTGYDTTDKDAEDANEGNTSEFTLVTAGATPTVDYVTPLTPRGSSESITAVSTVTATQSGPRRAPLTVNTSPDLPATSTLATRIKEASVQGDSQWTNRWASGMRVYEILPEKDGFWVASIGQGQAVSYRAAIAPDGSVSVTNVETGASSTAKAPDSPASGAAPSRPVAEMTDEELLQLVIDATTELKRRGGQGQ